MITMFKTKQGCQNGFPWNPNAENGDFRKSFGPMIFTWVLWVPMMNFGFFLVKSGFFRHFSGKWVPNVLIIQLCLRDSAMSVYSVMLL